MGRDLSRSRAILISNAAFSDDGIPDLPGAVGCAPAMGALLTSALCGWPTDRVEILQDMAAPPELARKLVELTEGVQDVLLLYYAGHGMRMPNGQLALALRDTSSNRTLLRHTAMVYKEVADILRGCPATTKLVILDCCHAELGNRASDQFQSVDIDAEPVDGLYCIWASKEWEKAKSPLSGGLTYFTDAFIGVALTGIPGKPPQLTIDQIFTELRARMLRANLPEPAQSGIRDAYHWPFAHNAARPGTHRDPDREIAFLLEWKAQAEARERALQAQVAEHAKELERLKARASSRSHMSAEEQEDLRNAISTTRRRLDDSTAAEAAARAGYPRPMSAPPSVSSQPVHGRLALLTALAFRTVAVASSRTRQHRYHPYDDEDDDSWEHSKRRFRRFVNRPARAAAGIAVLVGALLGALLVVLRPDIVASGTPTPTRSPSLTPSASPVDCVPGTLELLGSAFGSIAEKAASAYRSQCKNAYFKFEFANGKDSAWGLGQVEQAVSDHSAQAGSMIAMYDGTTNTAKGLTPHPMGMFIYSVVAHTGLIPGSDITVAELKQLFGQPGCVPGKVAVGLQAGSATRVSLLRLFGEQPSDSNIPEACSPPSGHYTENSYEGALGIVSGTPNAIGYVAVDGVADGHLEVDGHPTDSPNVSVISIDGVAPTPENVHNGSYHFAAVENLYTVPHPSPLAQSFLTYLPRYLAEHQVPDFITCSSVPQSMAIECPTSR